MDKSFPLKVIILLFCIAAGCVAGGYFLFSGYTWFAIACLTLVCFPCFILLKAIQHIHEKIDYFIDAISNNDYTFRFSMHKKMWTSSADLSFQLNRVKQVMQQKRLVMQEQEKYYEILLGKINSGVILVNENQHVMQTNEMARKLLGKEVFTHLKQLEPYAPELYAVFGSIKSGEQQKVLYTNEKESVELLVQGSSVILRNNTYKLLVINNVRQLLDEQEVETWTKLFRILAHEIMNTIAPITSLSDSLLQLQNDPEAKETLKQDTMNGLQVIHETGKGLISFVESYRRFMRIPSPEKTLLEVPDFLHGIILLCSHFEYFNNIKIEVNIHHSDPLYADANLLGQVMINLVKNSLQAIGQQMSKSTEGNIPETEKIIKLSYKKGNNDTVILEVSDNGPGIPSDLLTQIFVPFFTTKTEGSGIGLSVARQIMRAHGGSIQVRSIPNAQTTFSLHFS